MTTESSRIQRRAIEIWEAETDLWVDGDEGLTRALTALAWRLWARKGSRWTVALARAVRYAREESALFRVPVQAVLIRRGLRLASLPRLRPVKLYARDRQAVRPDQLAGFGSQRSVPATVASNSTGTPNSG